MESDVFLDPHSRNFGVRCVATMKRPPEGGLLSSGIPDQITCDRRFRRAK